MAYGFAASRLVNFVSKYDHPDRWFQGYRALAEEPSKPLDEIISGVELEDRNREALMMDIELEAELLMLYFQDVLSRVEEGIVSLADGSDEVSVRDLHTGTLLELGSP